MFPFFFFLFFFSSTNHFHCYMLYSGYVPPEYVRKGIYSTKSDVYSFGVLLLQIISGKRTACYYGTHENLNLLDYVSYLVILSMIIL
jgi:serine/threonine protein kinase